MGTSSERVFNGSGKGYLPAGTIGNRTHILSERLKVGTEFKRLKKGHRPAPMPPTWTHILSYKPIPINLQVSDELTMRQRVRRQIDLGQLRTIDMRVDLRGRYIGMSQDLL